MGVLRQLFATGATVHAAASLFGVARSLGMIPELSAMVEEENNNNNDDDRRNDTSVNTRRRRKYASMGVSRQQQGRLDPLIEGMYSGRGAEEEIGDLVLSDDVVFEDACVRCEGRSEVIEAFRALKAIQPEIIGFAEGGCGDSRGRDYDLSEKYSPKIFGGTFTFEIRSRLMVTMNKSGQVVRIEERWNHIPLVPQLGLFRRINGIASFYFTSFFLG